MILAGLAVAYIIVPGAGPSLLIVGLLCIILPLLVGRVRLRAQEVLRIDEEGVRLLRVAVAWEEISQIVVSGQDGPEIEIGVLRRPDLPGRTLVTDHFSGELDLSELVSAVRAYGPEDVAVVRLAEDGRHVALA